AASGHAAAPRVNDVLNERLHIGSKAVAATKRTSVASAIPASGSRAERGLWPNVRLGRTGHAGMAGMTRTSWQSAALPNSTCHSHQKLWSNGNIGSVDYASLCFLEHRIDSF